MIHDPRGNQLQFASQRVSSITVLFQTAKELSCNVFRVLMRYIPAVATLQCSKLVA